MGLDIYLKYYKNFNKTKKSEKEYEDFSDNLWNEAGEYDDLSQNKKDEIREKIKKFSKELGLGEYGSDEKNTKTIEIPHPEYPEHYFKIGYFRSSYNDGGIEHILRNYNLPTLGDIINPSDDYCFQPNWKLVLEKINKLIKDLKEVGSYRVHCTMASIFESETKIKDEKEALKVFTHELGKNIDYNYSNRDGEFSINEPLKVLALIPGTYSILRETPCVYVITEGNNEWYIQALEIIKDTCNYVLQQKDKQKYYIHWSG